MEPHIIVAPNLNGKVYREFCPQQTPINTFLDFIDIYNDQVLLGSSNLNGRYWDGSISIFKKFRTDINFDIECVNGIHCCDVGVTDGKILHNNKIAVVSHDSGEIKLFNIEENEIKFIIRHIVSDHEDFITEISLWNDDNLVTSSADASIKLWKVENDDLHCLHTYNHAHSNLISSVSASKNDINLFASCSYDRTALLWDKRMDDTGKVIYENEFCALTRVEWHPTKPNLIAVGNSSGDVYLVDVREPKEFVAKNSFFNRSIHRTMFNTQGLLAVCADDSKVVVLDCTTDDMKVMYVDDLHRDFVRGLAWKDNVLVSCGWDKQILLHHLN